MMTAQPKGRRLARSSPWPTVLACLILLAAIFLSFGLGAMLATARREDKPPQAVTTSPTPEPSAALGETSEPVRYRDDIVSEGRLLAYGLQEIMQDCCEVSGYMFFAEVCDFVIASGYINGMEHIEGILATTPKRRLKIMTLTWWYSRPLP